jgi:hypothetical protein
MHWYDREPKKTWKCNSHLGWTNKKSPNLRAKLNEIGLYLYFRYRPNLMPMFSFSLDT